MPAIRPHPLPEHALLAKYANGVAYTDCYITDVPMRVSHAAYVEAFYTTAVFKLERLLLAWFVSRPSSDVQARRLAAGELDSFAAWDVEARSVNQLLMCDFQGRTRSWLMVAPVQSGDQATTRLYFGSAVVPAANKPTSNAGLGIAFRGLLRFHKVYSKILLSSASSRLARSTFGDRDVHDDALGLAGPHIGAAAVTHDAFLIRDSSQSAACAHAFRWLRRSHLPPPVRSAAYQVHPRLPSARLN